MDAVQWTGSVCSTFTQASAESSWQIWE